MLNVHDGVVAANGEVDGLTRTLEQKLHHADGLFTDIESIAHETAVFKEGQTQTPAAVAHAVHKAILGKIPEQTMHGRHMNFRHFGNFMQTDRVRAIG